MPEKTVFDKKNVLVTGGAGFIGSFLCERLLKDGNRVICLDNFSTSRSENIDSLLKDPDFEFIRADINEPVDLVSYPELARFDIKFQGVQEVYHLACPTAVKNFEEFRVATALANSVGMRNALDLAVRNKSKFFQASSSVIYGERKSDGSLFNESDAGSVDVLSPRACYDEGKRWAEAMANTYASVHGLDVRIGRIFRTYGPRMPLKDGHMVPDFILHAIDGEDLVVYGDESFRTSLAYVTDIIDGIVRIMEQTESVGPVNIGSDYDVKIVDVANKIIELTGSSSKVVFEEPILFMTQLGLPELTRAKDELGWLPLVSLEQGLKKSIEYAVANRGLLRSM